MTVAIANQRNFESMNPVLATPGKRTALFPGPEPPGVISAHRTRSSGTSLVMARGAVGPGSDAFHIANIAHFPRLLLGGVEAARSRLPAARRDLAQGVPLIHGMELG